MVSGYLVWCGGGGCGWQSGRRKTRNHRDKEQTKESLRKIITDLTRERNVGKTDGWKNDDVDSIHE